MKIEQKRWDSAHGWIPELIKSEIKDAQLILIFGATSLLREQIQLQQIKETYPHAHAFGCSTAGEICGTQVTDDSIVVTAIKFEHTQIRDVKVNLNQLENSYQAGEFLAKALPFTLPSVMAGGEDKLVHVLALS
jgi:hypothetical protein